MAADGMLTSDGTRTTAEEAASDTVKGARSVGRLGRTAPREERRPGEVEIGV